MTEFRSFEPALAAFLQDLRSNNERGWFTANRERYEETVREPAHAFIRTMAPALAAISPHFRADDRKTGGSLMRVHRDTRFARDKTPYKTNVGIQFRHALGRDVHAPGFYVHLEPESAFLGAGVWRPDSGATFMIRARIDEEPGRLAWSSRRRAVPGIVPTRRREPQAGSPRVREGPSTRGRPQAKGLHRHPRASPRGRARAGVPGSRGRPDARCRRIHAIPLRSARRTVLMAGRTRPPAPAPARALATAPAGR